MAFVTNVYTVALNGAQFNLDNGSGFVRSHLTMPFSEHCSDDGSIFGGENLGTTKRAPVYRGVNKGLYVLLSRTQAGPGRTVKQEQEELSRNHIQTFICLSVVLLTVDIVLFIG